MEILNPLLHSMVPDEIAALIRDAGQPRFRADQMRDWLYRQHALDWDRLTNIPATLRERLAAGHDISGLELVERQVSRDDGTRKFLFRLRDGNTVESVIIPMTEHPTFCISSQVGCAMACRFCATARGGLVRHLDAGEILEQVIRLRADLLNESLEGHGDRQFNIVFMGMGEPLDNWEQVRRTISILTGENGWGLSRRRVQISTSGPREGLEKLLAEPLGVGLTLSLGGSNDEERRKIMPVPGRTPLADAVRLAGQYGRAVGRRVTLAWVLIEGKTDLPEQAERIGALARSGPFKVNLIPMNPLDDGKDLPPAWERCLEFQNILTDSGVMAFVRASGGKDIAAACGQLRRRRQRLEKKDGAR